MKTTAIRRQISEVNDGPRRGDLIASGGRFVGQAATAWVCYGDDRDFAQMSADFDRIWGGHKLRVA